jgi:hypothetical protein
MIVRDQEIAAAGRRTNERALSSSERRPVEAGFRRRAIGNVGGEESKCHGIRAYTASSKSLSCMITLY